MKWAKENKLEFHSEGWQVIILKVLSEKGLPGQLNFESTLKGYGEQIGGWENTILSREIRQYIDLWPKVLLKSVEEILRSIEICEQDNWGEGSQRSNKIKNRMT